MGKMFTFLTILIFIDIIFLATGIIDNTITSSILKAILDPKSFTLGDLFLNLIGNPLNLAASLLGIGAMIASLSGIGSGIIISLTDTKLFAPIALTLSLITPDFVAIYNYLATLNGLLAVIIMAPITILYALTVVEWLARKD